MAAPSGKHQKKPGEGNNQRDDYQVRDLLKKTEDYLRELSTFEEMHGLLDSPDGGLESWVAGEMQDDFLSDPAEPPALPMDGYANLRLSEDGMSATASFFPPKNGGKPCLFDTFEAMLQHREINTGILWDEIRSALFSCNSEGNPQYDVPVARGKEPVPMVPAHYILEASLTDRGNLPEEQGGRVDYRQVSPFTMVTRGDKLATLVPKQEGFPGLTVQGKEVPSGKKSPAKWKPGKNCQDKAGTVTASCDGRFILGNESFEVNEVLLVNSDVGYETGNIDFGGDVILQGGVRDNFHISAGGSVFCEKTMDASVVECKKDLVVKQGIIGRKEGKVIAGGNVRAKFIENCYVEARENLQIEIAIMNSSVYCAGRVDMYKRGVVVGGTLYAQNGVRAMQLGTEMGPRTEIYCGIDYGVSKKLEWIQHKNMQLVFTLRQVEDKLKKYPQDANLLETRKKIKAAMQMLAQSSQSLVFNLDKNDRAEVQVWGSVYPGVYIEICHVSYVVGRKMNSVLFRLDKSSGRVVADKLTAKHIEQRGNQGSWEKH